jgi:hypothetical protein
VPGGELVEEAGGLDGGRDQDEAGVEQGEASVHHLEQLIEDHRRGDIGRGDHQVGGEPGPVEQLVGLDVLRRRGQVALDDQHGGDDGDGKGPTEDVDQVQAPGDPRQPTRRTISDGIHQRLLHRGRASRRW